MKNDEEIRSRIVELLGEELERRVDEATQRLPHRCEHNHRQALDTRKHIGGVPNEGYNVIRTPEHTHLPVIQTMGLCMLGSENPDEWPGTICDEPIDAKRCPLFSPTDTRQSIYNTFVQDVQDVTWLQTEWPELHSLLWVAGLLGNTPRLPWWKRLWFFFRPMPLEPVHPPFDPKPYLAELERSKDALWSRF